ncbi:hypothetical protein [Bacillus sp. 445_BSPC]|uniref:hypothetical protein n=1 Tax=Bacillus sp. 445_BSPC TaxID=1581712 RepID=UPI0006622412|nr:hypothetical protein [Bacillus sp. 445_BSPC]
MVSYMYKCSCGQPYNVVPEGDYPWKDEFTRDCPSCGKRLKYKACSMGADWTFDTGFKKFTREPKALLKQLLEDASKYQLQIEWEKEKDSDVGAGILSDLKDEREKREFHEGDKIKSIHDHAPEEFNPKQSKFTIYLEDGTNYELSLKQVSGIVR